ncbi:MAG: acetylxylan esterase [Verrucomicrobia bacterium]|nr:acetylxylan esterase [Verrucomicrobiota bacterium]
MIPKTFSSNPIFPRRNHSLAGAVFATLALACAQFASSSHADGPRVLPQGTLPNDKRLQPPKDLDGYFPFQVSKTPEEWSKRAERVRQQILVSQGLWPMPTKTPLNPVIHGKIERDDYTVEKVYFESVPGFFVTGNLYRPKGKSGKLPGVLCPHGHWTNGRFTDAGVEGVRKEIAQGAERFEEGGRSPLQARCVQLARMGCVVFHYDMIGYADSQQISFELAHRFAKQRPEMNAAENWGLYSPQAEAHLQSVMGLQTLNSIRSLDFLLSLPEVDPQRIACTGASGGGTQTFLLSAIDPRVAVSFPAVMVSTAMQGGCTCENSCLLRVGAGNIEFAALYAPKPLGMTSADDWTKEMTTKGFPELQQHYKMMGAADKVMLKALVHFGHNYNAVSRGALYGWVNKHFKLGFSEPILESDYKRLTKEEMSVWDDKHPKPEGGPEFERKLLRWLTEDSATQLKEMAPAQDQKTVAPAMNILIGRNLAEAGDVEWDLKEKKDRGGYLEMSGLLRNTTHGEELPIAFLYPKQWNGQSIVWLDERGKSGLFTARDAEPQEEIRRLLDAGATVIGVDLLYQGEFLADGKPAAKTRRVKNTRESAAYTFGYNHTLFAQRVHDILTVVKFVRNYERKTKTLHLVGLGATGPLAAAARAQASDAIDGAVIETNGFRFAKVTDIHDVNFLPGAAKYGDVAGMIKLGKEIPILLLDEPQQGEPKATRASAVRWLLSRN